MRILSFTKHCKKLLLVMKDTEKVELLYAVFASVFTVNACPQEPLIYDTRDKVCRKENFPLVEEYQFRDHLHKLDTTNPWTWIGGTHTS